MWYAIEGYDAPQSLERRLQSRPAHLARLVALKDAGRLLLAGPCPAIDAEDQRAAVVERGPPLARHEPRIQPGRAVDLIQRAGRAPQVAGLERMIAVAPVRARGLDIDR